MKLSSIMMSRLHFAIRTIAFAMLMLSLFLGCCGSPYARVPGVLQSVAPAMASILEVHTIEQQQQVPILLDPSLGPPEPPTLIEGVGSAIVVDERGYLLTCWHVVSGKIDISVDVDRNQPPVNAVVVAADPLLDLALLKVDMPLQHCVVWGNSAAMLEGDIVFAVGFPFGTTKTAEIGIISSLHMVVGYPVIVTDAAINPGHSGGGLFNERGELIGINNMIYSPQGLRANVGLAYCIPGNTARLFALRNTPPCGIVLHDL